MTLAQRLEEAYQIRKNQSASILKVESESSILETAPRFELHHARAQQVQLSGFERADLQNQLRVLMTRINWIREQLGENPKRCAHCGELLK
jgi:hypothetical protein